MSFIFLYNNSIHLCQGQPYRHARTGSMMMAELEVDQTNLPRVQEGEQTPSQSPSPDLVILTIVSGRKVSGQGHLLTC